MLRFGSPYSQGRVPMGSQFPPSASLPRAWNGLLNRRDLLRVGSLGLAATLVPGSLASAERKTPAKARSVILLWMAGGVTHIDSFDPKPDAPPEVRGTLSTIPTSLPGVRFTEVMPGLARQTHNLALVRSFSHDSDDHFLSQAWALSGRRVLPTQITTEPNIGSIIAKLHGPRAGFPGYVAVPGTTRPGPPGTNEFVGGWLGREYDPFCTGGKPKNEDFTAKVLEAPEDQFHQQALEAPPGLDELRLAGRQSLRERLEAGLRALEGQGLGDALAGQYRSAFAMLQAP